MQNTCWNTAVFVQGLPKSPRAFPQLSQPMLATRMFPSRHRWYPQPGSEERAGEGPTRQTRPRLSRAHLASLPGLQGMWSRLWAVSRVLGRSPVHLQNMVLLAPWPPTTLVPCRETHSLPCLLAPCGSPIWAELRLAPKPSSVPWGRASNRHDAEAWACQTHSRSSLQAGAAQIHHHVPAAAARAPSTQ